MTWLNIMLTILILYLTWRFWRAVWRTANRSVASTEASAAALQNMQQIMLDAMTPEAKQRIYEAQQLRIADARVADRARHQRQMRRGAIFLAIVALILFISARGHAQPFYGDPYDGARAAQWQWAPPNVYQRAPQLPPLAYAPPPLAYTPPIAPSPLGWIWGHYAPCANPACDALVISVGVDGLKIGLREAGLQEGQVVLLVGDHAKGERISQPHNAIALLGSELDILEPLRVQLEVPVVGKRPSPEPVVRVVVQKEERGVVGVHAQHDLG